MRRQRYEVAGFVLAALCVWGCGSPPSGPATAAIHEDDAEQESGRPNIVLIVTDEMPADSVGVGALADSGIRFLEGQALPAAAGSASWSSTAIRSSLLTGLHPEILGLRDPADELSAVAPAGTKTFPELLRRAGYFTVRNGVARHGFSVPGADSASDRQLGRQGLLGAWDVAGAEADWRRGPGEPCTVGCWGYTADRSSPFFAMFNVDGSPHAIDQDVARVLAALETDEVADNTVVIAIATEGAQPSAIARWRGRLTPGTVADSSFSVLDIAPTVLALAGARVPPYMKGRALIGALDASSASDASSGSDDASGPGASEGIKTQTPAWEDGTPPVASAPTGYPTGGVFHIAPMVELSCETEASTIIYTTERVAPFYWRLYTGPFRMRFWTLRFQCGRLGYRDSEVVSYDFDID